MGDKMLSTLALSQEIHGILAQKENLEAIFNSLSDGIIVVDNGLKITHVNKAALKITGYSVKEILGQSCTDILRGSLCGTECFMAKTRDQKAGHTESQVEIIRKDGAQRTCQLKTSLLYNMDGKATGVLVVFNDQTELDQLREELKERYSFHNIVGKSRTMLSLYSLIKQVTSIDTTVLIEGESGTGKELVARAIHYQSSRSGKPFVKINCSALAVTILESELFGHVKGAFTGALYDRKGRFEEANGGTIFLDEIGDISPLIQTKLLRILEDKEFERVGENRTRTVDIRIITATNKDLKELVIKGVFREDLYYRLKILPIHLPSLRERREDIPLLVNHFINHFNRQMGKDIRDISREAMEVLLNYEWPGNVRELEHAIEYAFVVCSVNRIALYHLPHEVSRPGGRHLMKNFMKSSPVDEVTRIMGALKETGNNHSEAARLLGISRTTFWRRLKAHQLIP
ncbi:MAG: sigma 54-interacting transcriptional regulator [Nitrospirae bacterium]|nr:sigma 54-interacting transcriptional regulator [Nitrospirota bacterium]